MAEEIDGGLRYLTAADLDAIAEYLLSLPPVENQVRKARKKRPSEFE
jgi:hypothetical protein